MKKICLWPLLFIFSFASIQVMGAESDELWIWSEEHKEQWQTMFAQVENLKKRHQESPIEGIEVLIAEPGDERIQSQFGHAMVRFISPQSKENPGSDLVLNFVAYVHTPRLSARGGLSGEYAIVPEVMTLSQALTKYLQNEGRPLRRMIIPTSKDMREDLLQSLFRWWSELEAVRPKYLEQAKNETRTLVLKKAALKYPGDDFLTVLIHSPQGGDLGVAALAKSEFPQLSNERWLELKTLPEDAIEKQELLNTLAFEKSLAAMKKKQRPGQWLIKIGPNLALLEPLADFAMLELPKNPRDYQEKIKQATYAFRERGHSIRSIRDLTVAQIFSASTEQLLVMPFSLWQTAVLAQKVDSLLISPEFETIRPPRMTIDELGRYTFLGQNCASALIRYFEKAELPARPGRSVARRIPTKLSEFLNESLLSPYPELKVERLAKLKEKLIGILGTADFTVFAAKRFTEGQKQQLVTIFQTAPVAALFYLIPELNNADRDDLMILNRPAENSFEAIHGLTILDPLTYQVCLDPSCAKKLDQILVVLFGQKAFEKSKKQMRVNTRQQISPRDYSRIDRRRNITPAPVYYKRAEVIKHLDLMDFLNLRFPRAL